MIDAMKQALEALEIAMKTPINEYLPRECLDAIYALRAAIAEASMQRLTDVQQEMEQEPAIYPEEARDMGLEEIPYYTHPPRREWVGLTDDEIDSQAQQEGVTQFQAPCWFLELCRAIEAKLKEKNS